MTTPLNRKRKLLTRWTQNHCFQTQGVCPAVDIVLLLGTYLGTVLRYYKGTSHGLLWEHSSPNTTSKDSGYPFTRLDSRITGICGCETVGKPHQHKVLTCHHSPVNHNGVFGSSLSACPLYLAHREPPGLYERRTVLGTVLRADQLLAGWSKSASGALGATLPAH